MKDNKGFQNITVSILFGAIGAFIAMLCTFYFGYKFIDFSFLSDSWCGENGGSVWCFFEEDWDSATYLSIITGFYNTIIAVLIGVLAAVAAIAFITIRSSALRQAEEAIEKEVDTFFKSSKAEEKINTAAQRVGGGELSKIQSRLETIEEVLSYNDLWIDNLKSDHDEEKTE